jgi:hypothetical protein
VLRGIWKGYTVFGVACGAIEAHLLHGGSNSLVFTLARGIGHQSSAASIPLSIRTALLRHLVQRFFTTTSRRTLYSFATNAFPELGARLAAASAASPEWNRAIGQPFNDEVSNFVKDLMNEKQTYPELSAVFADLGYDLRVSGIENILVLRVNQMNPEDRVYVSVPLLPTDELPVSAATYFKLKKTSN